MMWLGLLAVVAEQGPVLPPRLEALYAAELDFVWRSLRRLGVPAREQEDAAHDVFLAIHQALPRFDPTRPVKPWIFGIAFRVASARRRKGDAGLELTDELEHSDGGEGGPDSALEARQARAQVHQALQTLSEEQRAVFVLHELEEEPMPAIAEALGVPLNTCYSRLRLGRARFTEALQSKASPELRP